MATRILEPNVAYESLGKPSFRLRDENSDLRIIIKVGLGDSSSYLTRLEAWREDKAILIRLRKVNVDVARQLGWFPQPSTSGELETVLTDVPKGTYQIFYSEFFGKRYLWGSCAKN